jgi:hypothetical protein
MFSWDAGGTFIGILFVNLVSPLEQSVFVQIFLSQMTEIQLVVPVVMVGHTEEEQHIVVENIWLIYDRRYVCRPKLRTICVGVILCEITLQYIVWRSASCDGHVLTGYESLCGGPNY